MAEKEKRVCYHCQKSKVVTSFIKFKHTDYFSDGIIPVCMVCGNKLVKEKKENGLNFLLKMMDVPFVEKLWNDIKEENSPFGQYLRLLSLTQNAHFYEMPYQEILTESTKKQRNKEIVKQHAKTNTITLNNGETITFKDEWYTKYGSEYTKEEILRMEKYVQDNSMIFEIDTPQKEVNLMDIAKINILKDKSLRGEDNKAVKDWTDTIMKLSKASGFFQVSESKDSYLGFETWGEMARDIERRGFVPFFPILEFSDEIDRMIEILAVYYKALYADDNDEIDITNKDETLEYLIPFIEQRFDLLRDKSKKDKKKLEKVANENE